MKSEYNYLTLNNGGGRISGGKTANMAWQGNFLMRTEYLNCGWSRQEVDHVLAHNFISRVFII